jgi:phosphoserine/homoserine phosphotransferase
MEGVLTPEVWIAVAERTGIPELRRTTRQRCDPASEHKAPATGGR